MTRLLPRSIAGALALVLLTAVTCRSPEGPVPIFWDQETCAECHMHIGDPRFAAQLQTGDAQVFNFDDAGCLFRYLRDHASTQIYAIWFRHSEADRWISRSNVRFVSSRETPMGSGLAAIDVSREGSIGFEEAKRESRGTR